MTASAVVRSKTKVAERVVELRLAPAGGEPFGAYEPGAHIDVILPGELTRQYSLLPPAPDDGTYRVAILLEPDSRGGSRYIHEELLPGATIGLGGPRNHFELLPANGYLFIAGGIGITPLMGMVAQAEAAGLPWQLFYGGRSRDEMAYLRELMLTYPRRLRVFPSEETGRMDVADVVGQLPPGGKIYCCGPKGMAAAVSAAAGVAQAGSVHMEHFEPVALDRPSQNELFTVQLARSGASLDIPTDRSILDVLDDEDIFIVSSCREGTCGSCETRVLAGEVDHRDVVLTDEEKLRGDTMMVCVSRAKAGQLVLDL